MNFMSITKSWQCCAAHAVVLMALANGSVHAATVELQDLFDGESLIAGDKLFADWELISLDNSGVAPDFSLIEVSTLDDGGSDPGLGPAPGPPSLDPGLNFYAGGQLSVTGGDFLNLSFRFSVTVLDPGYAINGNSLTLTDYETDGTPAGASIVIEEDIFDIALNPLGDPIFPDEKVFVDDLLGTAQLSDSITFSPQSKIFVEKNLLLSTSGSEQTATLTSFEQRFSHVAITHVPEPATALLMVLGLAGFAARGKNGG